MRAIRLRDRKKYAIRYTLYIVAAITYLTRLHLTAKDAHKLGQVLKVTRHLGGQYHVDNGAARRFVGLLIEVLEYVNLVIACRATTNNY